MHTFHQLPNLLMTYHNNSRKKLQYTRGSQPPHKRTANTGSGAESRSGRCHSHRLYIHSCAIAPVLERQYPLREAGKWMAAGGEPHRVNVGVAVPPQTAWEVPVV